MAFIRLSDDYNDHPKIDNLTDGAFRLWHQTLGFCRKFKTDGLVPFATLRKMKSYSPKRAHELQTPWRPGEQPLWHSVDDFGIRVHDFLEWNLSKEEEQNERTAAAARMRKFRTDRKTPNGYGVTNGVTNGVTEGVTNAFVPGRVGSSSVLEEKKVTSPNALTPDDLADSGARFLERYGELYAQYRHGAHYRPRPNLDWTEACDLLRHWDFARLEKLAVVFLTTDEDWIARTDRSFKIFAIKASWADMRLRAVESGAA